MVLTVTRIVLSSIFGLSVVLAGRLLTVAQSAEVVAQPGGSLPGDPAIDLVKVADG